MHKEGIRGLLIQSQFYDECALLRIHGKLICVLLAESKRPQAYGKCRVGFGLIMPKRVESKMISKSRIGRVETNSVYCFWHLMHGGKFTILSCFRCNFVKLSLS